MKPPKIFVKNKKDAEIFISEFLVLMSKYRNHEKLIKNIDLLKKRMERGSKNNSKSGNTFTAPIIYDKDLEIISNFVPGNIKILLKTYPPYVFYIKSQIFDKIKGTESKVNAFTFPFSNCIIITEDYSKRDVHRLLIHEFLHYASELGSDWKNWKHGINKYKPWVVEGITELYTKRLATANNITYVPHKKYKTYLDIMSRVESILGKDNLKKLYFNGNIESIILSKGKHG